MGRRFLCDSSTSPVVDRGRIYCTVSGIRCPMEFSQDEIFRRNPALYWLRLGFTLPISLASRREARGHPRPAALLAALYEPFFCTRCCQFARQVGAYLVHLFTHSAFLKICLGICHIFYFSACTLTLGTGGRFILGRVPHAQTTQLDAAGTSTCCRSPVVGGRDETLQYFIWHRCIGGRSLGCLAMGRRGPRWPALRFRHRMGRSGSSGAGLTPCIGFGAFTSCWGLFLGLLRQFIGRCGNQQGPFEEPRNKQNPEAHLLAAGRCTSASKIRICREQRQRHRCPLAW
ncbi:hypothetical protein B0H12DRAFT_1053187, partial [Mycena haematopus]